MNSDPAELAELVAVQQLSLPGPLDWLGRHDLQEPARPPFYGALFIVNSNGAQLCEAALDEATDQAADITLTRLGLHRFGDWTPDRYGRRTAQVTAADSLPDPEPGPIRDRTDPAGNRRVR